MALEDTQTNEALIQEMLRDAEKAPEPGMTERVIHKGDADQPAPMTLAELTSAGWVYIYESRTGERSTANKNMLPQLLKVKNTDGTPRFVVTKPLNPPFPIKRGTFKCLLHGDDPNRAHYSELGYAICPKSNITSPYQVRRHMIKSHKQEWQAIEQERKDTEKAEDREFQHAMLGAVRPKEAPLYVSKKDRAREE